MLISRVLSIEVLLRLLHVDLSVLPDVLDHGLVGLDDLAWTTEHQTVIGDLFVARDQRVRPDDTATSYLCAVEDGRVHSNDAIVSDDGPVDQCAVTYGHTITDGGRIAVIDVHHTAVLDGCALAYPDRGCLTADRGGVPDRGFCVDLDVADNGGIGCYEATIVYFWMHGRGKGRGGYLVYARENYFIAPMLRGAKGHDGKDAAVSGSFCQNRGISHFLPS